jgi:zinc/manganese transport system ATP-binding protein
MARSGPLAPPDGAARGATVAAALTDAHVTRGARTVWAAVNLTIPRGAFVAVLGPNGAGKSTLLHVLMGFVALRAGRATVLDRVPGDANGEIGYLPQRRSFGPASRIRGVDIVRLGLDGARWGVPLPSVLRGSRHREATGRVDQVIGLVGASSYARRAIGELSGGEQQRLLIAQALVREPRMLLLDEPLDSLDLPNQAMIAALIQRICRERGITILLVTHDVNPILGYVDRVVYLANGHAVAGPPRDVITTATLTALYGVPVEVLHASDGRLVVVGQPDAPFVHGHRHDADHTR